MSSQPRGVLPLLVQCDRLSLGSNWGWWLGALSAWPDHAGTVAVRVRPERLIADGVGPGRNWVRRGIRRDAHLRRSADARVNLAVMGRANRRGRRRRA